MKGLSFGEFEIIIGMIKIEHELIKGRAVKYLESSYDFRTHSFWRIVFRPFGNEVEFTTANRFDNPKHDNLYDEIMEWLDSGKDGGK